MNEFLEDYYGAGWQNIRTYIDKITEAASLNHAGIYDNMRNMLLKHMTNDESTAFSREMLALWETALEMAETAEQKAHVEKSSIQAYYLAHTKGNAMERKEYLNKLYVFGSQCFLLKTVQFAPITFPSEQRLMFQQTTPILAVKFFPVALISKLWVIFQQTTPIPAAELFPIAFVGELRLFAQ